MLKNDDECLAYLEQVRWGANPQCPYCHSTRATAYKNERRYHCNNCFTSYSVTVGTLFHKTHVDLQKWFKAIFLVLENPQSVTVRSLAKEVGVNKNTASYMVNRIRRAMSEDVEFLEKLRQDKEG
jgi:transposase-like protein